MYSQSKNQIREAALGNETGIKHKHFTEVTHGHRSGMLIFTIPSDDGSTDASTTEDINTDAFLGKITFLSTDILTFPPLCQKIYFTVDHNETKQDEKIQDLMNTV